MTEAILTLDGSLELPARAFMNVTVACRDASAIREADLETPPRSANQSPFDRGGESAHWSDIAVEDDFGFDVRSSKEVS
jgi:hypothetical protein